MRILQVCSKFLPEIAAGSSVVAYAISKELAKRGHDVTVVSSNARDRASCVQAGRATLDGLAVFHFRSVGFALTRSMNVHFTPGMASFLAKRISDYDIIHLHEFRTFQNGVTHYFATRRRIPYLLQAHGSVPDNEVKAAPKFLFDRLLGRALLNDASRLLALSDVEANQYRRAGVPAGKIRIVTNGVDLPLGDISVLRGKFKSRCGLREDQKIVLYVGRISPLKGLDFLIKGFARLCERQSDCRDVLVIAGPDDGYLNRVRMLVRVHRVADRVLITGPIFGVEKQQAYADAALVASLDSLKEIVFLLVPLEAAACGTPCLVTKANYLARLAAQGGFGLAMDYGNVEDLSAMMAKLTRNEALRNEMGDRGIAYVRQNHSWGSICDGLETIYEEVLAEA